MNVEPQANITIYEKSIKPTWERSDVRQLTIRANQSLLAAGVDFEKSSMDDRCRILRNMVLGCQTCPLSGVCVHPTAPEGPIEPKLIVVGRSPMRPNQGYTSLDGRTPQGRAFDYYLALLGVTRSDIYFTNAIHCPDPQSRTISQVDVRTCSFLKVFEWMSVKIPKVVLLLGYHSHQMFFDYTEPSLTQIIGNLYETTLMGTKTLLVPIHHPLSVVRDSDRLGSDVTKILNVVRKYMNGELL